MANNSFYSKNQIEKLGNAIIFLAEKIQPLSKTKLLKLIYLIEEISIRKNGLPFFGIDFQLWKLGPVPKEIFIELSSTPSLLESFIETANNKDGTYVTPRKAFSDDEFSDLELEILEIVVDKFRESNAQELVKITHRENFPWYNTAKSLGYLELFENNQCNATDIVIDLSALLDESPEQKNFYLDTLDFQKQRNHLKRVS